MNVKIKKIDPDAVIPKYAKPGDAGMDLVCTEVDLRADQGKIVYHTGLAMEIPPGHVGLLFPRSSVHKKSLSLANSVGVIDSGYRGEIKLIFKIQNDGEIYTLGDRIGQIMIMPYPEVNFVETEELGQTDRGAGGFGSTGA